MPTPQTDLLQGTLDLLILTTLQWGPQHGYAMSLAIKANSGDVFQVETGSLYPALHRLEKQGWIASEWKQTEANQRGDRDSRRTSRPHSHQPHGVESESREISDSFRSD